MKRVLITTTTAAVVLLVASSMAIAGEVGGNNIAVPKPATTTEMPNGMTYVTTGNSQVCTTNDPNHPLNQASGDCDGACVVDADGHLAFFTWTGQNEGTWRLVGGSGKYAHATGKGTWEGTGAYASGIVRNSWQGDIVIK